MSCIVYQTNKKTGITYAYESISYWDKEKKQPRSKRQYIGRVDDETGEIIPKQSRKSKSSQKDSPSKEWNDLVAEIEAKDTMVKKLSVENEQLKNELATAYETMSKIKSLCEDLV